MIAMTLGKRYSFNTHAPGVLNYSYVGLKLIQMGTYHSCKLLGLEVDTIYSEIALHYKDLRAKEQETFLIFESLEKTTENRTIILPYSVLIEDSIVLSDRFNIRLTITEIDLESKEELERFLKHNTIKAKIEYL